MPKSVKPVARPLPIRMNTTLEIFVCIFCFQVVFNASARRRNASAKAKLRARRSTCATCKTCRGTLPPTQDSNVVSIGDICQITIPICVLSSSVRRKSPNSYFSGIVRGCIDERTPLLCENRKPQVYTGPWPVLHCCKQEWCNKDVVPTVPTPWLEQMKSK